MTLARAQRNIAQNLLLERELGKLSRAFAAANIELLVLKGVPLTRRLYGGLDQRYSVDNDLLVRRRDVTRAAGLLQSLGYRASPQRTLQADLDSTFQHPMRRLASDGATLRAELHWQAFPPQLFTVPESELFRRAIPASIGDSRFLVFDDVMTLLHLASHHVQHRCAEAKVLADVGAAWQRFQPHVDPLELTSTARELGLGGALAFSLDAARRSGFCSSPSPIASRRAALLARLLPAATLGAEPGYTSVLGSLLLASPERIPVALLYELLPPPAVLARVYGVEPSPWLYARYPLRLLRPIRRLLARAS